MKSIALIAQETIKELIRDRIVWGFLGASILLVLASLLLGTLSFAEHVKITIDLGLGMIHFLGLAMSLFLGVSIIGKELRNRTVYSILARPISRFEYLLGKYFGLMGIVALSCIILGGSLLLLLLLLKTNPTQSLFAAVFGIFCEMAVVSSFALFLSLFLSPTISAFAGFGWWAVGTLSTDMLYFSSKARSELLQVGGKFLYFLLPRLDLFQVKNRVVYEPTIEWVEILKFTTYAFSAALLLLLLSTWTLSKKEL